MELRQGDLFQLATARAAWLARRHAVLTTNIANADTPGFRPLDLRPPEPGRGAVVAPSPLRPVLARTAAAHLAGLPALPPPGERGRPVEGWETAPAGNAVVIEEQAQKLVQTQLDHQLATGIYGKLVALTRAALGVAV
jgi:flagellar basal-body rod protein FlgB